MAQEAEANMVETSAQKDTLLHDKDSNTCTKHGNRNKGQNLHRTEHQKSKKGFQGSIWDMNGHIFECFSKKASKDQSKWTLQETGEYITRTYKYPGNMTVLYTELKMPTLVEPKDLPTGSTDMKMEMW